MQVIAASFIYKKMHLNLLISL